MRDLIGDTGRIYTTFNQTVTATGRLSSSDPNLQNIPVRTEEGRTIRALFEPGEGYDYLLSADYSQIELRILAHMSSDERFIDAFVQNQDIHARTAAEVFNVPLNEVDSTLRRHAKAVNFGIVYGISDFGLAKDLHIEKKEAKRYIDNYFARYTGVKAFLDKTVEQAHQDGYDAHEANRGHVDLGRRVVGHVERLWKVGQAEYQHHAYGRGARLYEHGGSAFRRLAQHDETEDERDEQQQAADDLADGAFLRAMHLEIDVVLVHNQSLGSFRMAITSKAFTTMLKTMTDAAKATSLMVPLT
jgi:hypothetical protein